MVLLPKLEGDPTLEGGQLLLQRDNVVILVAHGEGSRLLDLPQLAACPLPCLGDLLLGIEASMGLGSESGDELGDPVGDLVVILLGLGEDGAVGRITVCELHLEKAATQRATQPSSQDCTHHLEA